MGLALEISTILGGITALWFFYDKRHVIFACFKIRKSTSINPLGLSDECFEFLYVNRVALLANAYLPIDSGEEVICKSLTNHGVLVKWMGKYRLSRAGRMSLNA